MKRRRFLETVGMGPLAAALAGFGRSSGVVATTETLDWRQDVPPLATWTYANGLVISTDSRRKDLAKSVCRFPIAAVISADRHHGTGEPAENCDLYRDVIRETNPGIKMLGHLNASESLTPSSPGQRVIHAAGGEHGMKGNQPQDNPGTIWYEKPKGRVLLRKTRWGSKAMMDFRLKRARDTLFAAMETQYVAGSRWWDGVFLDQLIVPGRQWGPSRHEQIEMISGLQAVLTRFRRRYPEAIVIGNSPWNFDDINGEVNEGRGKAIGEIATSSGHSKPELNVYMYKPRDAAPEEKIAVELGRAVRHDAFFAYHYGDAPFQSNPWPDAFGKLLDHFPKWQDSLIKLGLAGSR